MLLRLYPPSPAPETDHLILFGGPAENPLVESRAPHLPVLLTRAALAVADRDSPLDRCVALVVCPDPTQRRRLIAVVCGGLLERFVETSAATPQKSMGLPPWRDRPGVALCC